MKTSKRKRSSKSEPVAEATDVASAPAVADSAEPVLTAEVVAAEPANEPVVAEAVAAEPFAAEAVIAEAVALESVAAEAVVAEAVALESVAAEAVSHESVAESVAEVAETDSVTGEAVASESVAEVLAPESVVAEAIVASSEPMLADAPSAPVESQVEPVIVLAANCSVKDAAALKTSLCAVSNESAAVTLDASAVERVDTATMQLLCAFVRDRLARNQGIVWRGKSQALHDAVRLLGVGALLGFEANGAAA